MEFETRVAEIIRRASDVKSFRFRRPEELAYAPGQYMYVTILIGDEKQTKPFTISSSPTETDFIEFTKRITDHEFSKALDQLKVGDWAYIEAPEGEFIFKGEYPKVALVTGGIGITPFRSMIKYCTDTGVKSQITLLYGNRNEETIAFREELDILAKQNHNLRTVHTLTQPSENWEGRRGLIDLQMIKEEIPDYTERVFYVCGPPGMVTSMLNVLKTLKIPEESTKTEHFSGY
ncbi:MAG TPA: FAD-binding oxidoreductase [Candidatus Krumholzibacteriaceae bacterium]|nr:FAD-binding oxidoreductase [Candidatus Krumholzibacteriaceae bacterium]